MMTSHHDTHPAHLSATPALQMKKDLAPLIPQLPPRRHEHLVRVAEPVWCDLQPACSGPLHHGWCARLFVQRGNCRSCRANWARWASRCARKYGSHRSARAYWSLGAHRCGRASSYRCRGLGLSTAFGQHAHGGQHWHLVQRYSCVRSAAGANRAARANGPSGSRCRIRR